MMKQGLLAAVTAAALSLALPLRAQVDPVKRDFVEFGIDESFEGREPLSAYAFYYHNQPDFLETNVTLRLVVAPTYVDSEVGFIGLLGPNTDVGIGAAGGGFADDYNEIRGGKFYPEESFNGNSASVSASVYHLFNPGDRIPLNLVVRGGAHYAAYATDDQTAPNFQLPDNQPSFNVRTGLRFGGIEPMLLPALAMEISAWYEGQFRADPNTYGYDHDRAVEAQSDLFWTREALDYTFEKSQQRLSFEFLAGACLDADRFSAFRLGGELPQAAEFPLTIPGYFYQEFSAKRFVLAGASYLAPVDHEKHWNLHFVAATAVVDYLPGTGQPGDSLSGVGGGIMYRAKGDAWRALVDYGYAINAVRPDGRGGNSINLMVQLDLDKIHNPYFHPLDSLRNWIGR